MTIEPNKKYSINDVLEERLIPGITGYTALYNLMTEKAPYEKNQLGVKRVPVAVTTARKIKVEHDGNPWGKISGKMFIKGIEIIKFLKMNGLLK